MKHKKKQEFDEQDWELVPTQPDTPQQANGSDCGVFTSIFADYLSRNLVRNVRGCPSALHPS
jgi:sentrin-specific protease 1